jgi:hypothetical protein
MISDGPLGQDGFPEPVAGCLEPTNSWNSWGRGEGPALLTIVGYSRPTLNIIYIMRTVRESSEAACWKAPWTLTHPSRLPDEGSAARFPLCPYQARRL